MTRMPRRVEKLNLSDHTLDINVRKCNYDKFDFSDVEDFVRELTGSRDYQFESIKQTLIYLWGGGYKDVTQMAKENWAKKPSIRTRFQSEENFLRHLPLPDRLSGVIHMATGTGKSYVIFAIAFLSILMGKVKRVLVLGPSSTVIEQGLIGKFREYLYGETGLLLQKKLPQKYQNIPINLLNENNPIEDNSIVIENINSIYNKENNSIGDTLFAQADEVLVLSDEVHHAYSHLKYSGTALALGEGGDQAERLWMKFIREEPKIKKHIGFTGTPYNQDEYFTDVIYDYSIKDAIEEKVIKKINPIIKVESETGETELTLYQRFEQILITHDENREKYAYRDSSGERLLKPITLFINSRQTKAEENAHEFVRVLAEFLKKKHPEYSSHSTLQMTQVATEKVICVISKPTDKDYQEKLDAIEETAPDKMGGKVEFVFAVNKLSEGWDVDNVYQIVPMEERCFDSKLLISQVLGRGLRLPRKVPLAHVLSQYPIVTITNHEKFANHIRELLTAVTECEVRFNSKVTTLPEKERTKHNFNIFNLDYMPSVRFDKAEPAKQNLRERTLVLTPSSEKFKIDVTYLEGMKKFQLSKNSYTLDQLVVETADRFASRQFESKHFDFGGGVVLEELPDAADIEKVIKNAMQAAGIEGKHLSEENKKQIDLFFNQFLPRGTKKRVPIRIEGELQPITTKDMDDASVRLSEIDRFATVFISEDYEKELDEENLFVIAELNKRAPLGESLFDLRTMAPSVSKFIRQLIAMKALYVVNSSVFKTSLNLAIVSHGPEREFIFKMIENHKYVDAWIKARDMGFYSVSFEFWKGGKDRIRRGFNPDFFIKIDLNQYLRTMAAESVKGNLSDLERLQDSGISEVIKVVEIKSDDDDDDTTPAKAKFATDHFENLNKKLSTTSAIDVQEDFQNSTRQHYTFDLLKPAQYGLWFAALSGGNLLRK